MLEFSWGARDWCGTCSSPVPEPEDVASASLLRAERVFDLSLSIATTKSKMGNAILRAIPGKHGFMTWKRPWPNTGWRLKIGFTSLEFCLGARHIAPQPLPTPFLGVDSHRTRDNVGGDNLLLLQVNVWTTDVRERLQGYYETYSMLGDIFRESDSREQPPLTPDLKLWMASLQRSSRLRKTGSWMSAAH